MRLGELQLAGRDGRVIWPSWIRFAVWAVVLFCKEIHCQRFKRIIGGQNTDIENAPYMLSMRLNGKHICGAVIIGRFWSLTAAHCCQYASGRALKLHSLLSRTANLHGRGSVHQIAQVVPHPEYTSLDDNYDICALRVTSPGFESSPVHLPLIAEHADEDKDATVSGWGYYQEDGRTLSAQLRSAKVTRVGLGRCRYLYRRLYTIHDCNVCYASKGADACKGDSGGPLVNKDGVLIGIVSFGDDCSYATLPGVYTSVRLFRAWIREVTGL